MTSSTRLILIIFFTTFCVSMTDPLPPDGTGLDIEYAPPEEAPLAPTPTPATPIAIVHADYVSDNNHHMLILVLTIVGLIFLASLLVAAVVCRDRFCPPHYDGAYGDAESVGEVQMLESQGSTSGQEYTSSSTRRSRLSQREGVVQLDQLSGG
ncbi:hypothetical protein ACFE04_022574 [Oxalis oulophora]